MTANILEIQDLKKTYKTDLGKPAFKAVKGVSFSCRSGICTGLLGHNGAGKTTSLKAILGLIHPDAGKVMFDGKAMTRESRRDIGYMPESNRMPLTLTCSEILVLHLRLTTNLPNKEVKQRIEETLTKVGLWDHRRKLTKQLSKGMGRRLAWAQATIHQPKFLILDEPFSGLDPKGRRDMRMWVEDYKKQGTSLLLCAHELSTVASLCEKINILKQGKVVYTSPDSDDVESGVFELSLSGADQSKLENMQKQQSLPQWKSLERFGHTTSLSFEGYENASKWMLAANQNNLVITLFKNSPVINETDAMQYF